MPAGRDGVAGIWRAGGPELALALVASLAFLGCLGSTELWGKREQRAAAEAVDTVDHGHWLVGAIQGRPRLEKPPLPRWITATLMIATGRRDEGIVRLPNALAGLALVALAYAWGRSAGGRAVGLASGSALASTGAFLVEMRQAGNDGMLSLFAAVALTGAWKRWGADPEDAPGAKRWARLFWVAVGLGFLCKGPVIGLWVGVPVVGFLASRGQFRSGLRLLVDGPGLVIGLILVAAWPIAVAVRYPSALGVWWLELGQKTGALGVEHGNARGSILVEGLGMTLPWTPLVLLALVGPLRRWRARRAEVELEPESPALALAWWWAFAPLAVLGTWDVAKPNYYLPALPAGAILAGAGWLGLVHRARQVDRGVWARGVLQATWSGLIVVAAVTPVVVHEVAPGWTAWALAAGLALGSASVLSALAWRSGRDSMSLGAIASGVVAVALIGYGVVAPAENAARGHRGLAQELTRTLPPGAVAWFCDDLDEGVWFYGPELDLRPVPALEAHQPATNRGHTLRAGVVTGQTRAEVASARTREAVDRLTTWADQAGPGSFLLIPRQAARPPRHRATRPVRPGLPRDGGRAERGGLAPRPESRRGRYAARGAPPMTPDCPSVLALALARWEVEPPARSCRGGR